jgi:hypothetical protein
MRNPHDNKDRYGRRHRQDDYDSIGPSMPGTPGYSEGVPHDDKNMPTVPQEVGVDKYYSDDKKPDQHMRDEVKNNR